MKFDNTLIYKKNSIWFISDTHFGHDNILKFEKGYHNFANIKEHDIEIITNWNAIVDFDDTVFFLGDFTMPKVNIEYVKSILAQLPGKIVWIYGNHDLVSTDLTLQKEFSKLANIIEFTNYKEILVEVKEPSNGRYKNSNIKPVKLFHYPIAEFSGMFKGHYHFYGHTHEKVYTIKNAYSVSTCLHNYSLVNFDTLDKKIKEINGSNRLREFNIRRVEGKTW